MTPATQEMLSVIEVSERLVVDAVKPPRLSILKLFNRTTST
jgi:hypothetical protein